MGKNVVREDVVKISYEVDEKGLDSLSKKLDKLGNGTKESVSKADSQFVKLGNEAQSVSQKVDGASKKAQDGLSGIAPAAQKAAGGVKSLSSNVQTLSSKCESVSKHLQSLAKGISGLGTKLTVGVTTPIIGAATGAVKMATDAATSYAKVQTIADSTKLSYDQLTKGVKKASNATGIAVTDFNEALYESLSAGVDTGKAIGFTNDMAKLAKGGFTSLDSAVDVVTSTLNAYGMSADQATAVSDKLITTQNIGKTTVDLLSSSLGMVIPTAKAFGVNLDTVCAGMADLTKNGIQTAEATTYMNAMFNELGKSGTVADKVLRKATGDGFTQLLGKGKSVTDVLAILQNTAKKSGKSLADMFGTAEGGKAALTIMKDGGTEFNGIVKSMANSAGSAQAAFEKMDSTPAAKFNKELNKLKNVGIETGTKLLPYVTKAVDWLDKLLDKVNQLSTSQQDMIMKVAGGAALVGPALKAISTPISGISKIVGAIGKSAAKKSAAKAIADTAAAAAPAAKKVGLLSKAGSALSGVFAAIPLPAKIALGVGAAAAVGIGLAIKHAHDEAVKADLAKRFGDVTLSAKECEDAAKQLASTPWTVKLNGVSEAKSQIDGFKESVQSAAEEMHKTEWKVNMGLKLSDDDKTSFQQSADNLAENSLKYLEQKHYTANLAIDAIMMPGTADYSKLTTLTDGFYSSQQSQIQKMGDNLKTAVSDALKDGVVSVDESGGIQALQTSIQGIVDKASNEEYTAKLKALSVTASAGGLTADSFQNFTKEMGNQTTDALSKADDSLKVVISELDMQLADGAITKNDYNNLVKSAQSSLNQRKADLQMKNYDITLEPLKSKYKDELSSANNALDSGLSTDFLGGIIPGSSIVKSAYSGISSEARDGLKKMVESAKPQTDEMEKTKQAWIDEGRVPPTAFMQSMQKTYELQAASGDITHQFDLLAGKINSSSATRKVYESMAKAGEEIPKELSDALKNEYGLVYEAGKGLIQKVKPEPTQLDSVKKMLKETGFEIPDTLAKSINEKGTDVAYQVKDLLGTLQEGYSLDSNQIVSLYTDLGMSIPKALADGIAKKDPATQKALVQMLTSLESGGKLSQSQIETFFDGFGKNLPDAISEQVSKAKPDVQKSLITSMESLYSGTALTKSQVQKMLPELSLSGFTGLSQAISKVSSGSQMEVTKQLVSMANGAKLGEKDIQSVFTNLNANVPKNIASLVANMSSSADKISAVNLFGKLYTNAQLGADELRSAMKYDGITIPDGLVSGLATKTPAVQQAAISLFQSVQSGAQASASQIKSLTSSVGLSFSDGFVSSLAQQKPNVQNQAMQLISTVGSAADSQRPALIATLAKVGGEPVQKMLASMNMKLSSDGTLVSTAGGKANQVIKTMDAKTASAILQSPKLADILNAAEKAAKANSDMQSYLSANPLHQTVSVEYKPTSTEVIDGNKYSVTQEENGHTIVKYRGPKAAGGIVQTNGFYQVAEENKREMIIPLQTHRERAIGLWEQTGQALGVDRSSGSKTSYAAPHTSYTPKYSTSNNRNYDDHSTYAPQFIASFGGNTPSNRDLERAVKKWIAESMQDAMNSRNRRNPADIAV